MKAADLTVGQEYTTSQSSNNLGPRLRVLEAPVYGHWSNIRDHARCVALVPTTGEPIYDAAGEPAERLVLLRNIIAPWSDHEKAVEARKRELTASREDREKRHAEGQWLGRKLEEHGIAVLRGQAPPALYDVKISKYGTVQVTFTWEGAWNLLELLGR